MTMILSFIRHFESEANAANILGGCIDYRLTATGKDQAAAVASLFLGDSTIDRIISSPLSRALETAAPFARISGLEPQTDVSLLEQNMGIFSGKTYAWAETHPDYELDKTARWDWMPPGGESYRMIAERLRPFFTRLEINSLKSEERILVVTHAVTLRLIQALLEDTIPAYPTRLARNGEILETEYRGLGKKHEFIFKYFGSDTTGKE